jgi:hypothetical protein
LKLSFNNEKISKLFNCLISLHARVKVLYIIESISLNSSKTLVGIMILLFVIFDSGIDFLEKLKNDGREDLVIKFLFLIAGFIISIEIIK